MIPIAGLYRQDGTVAEDAFIPKRRLIITGLAKSGKDTLCEMIGAINGMTSVSSSRIAIETIPEVFFRRLEQEGVLYGSIDEAYDDRENHRQVWFEIIRDWTMQNDQILARTIFENYDCYNGLRNYDELVAIRESDPELTLIWVERDNDGESHPGMESIRDEADYIFYNRGSLEQLQKAVERFCKQNLEA